MSLQNSPDVVSAIKRLIKFYVETLYELGDIPVASKPKPIVDEVLKVEQSKPQAERNHHAQHDRQIKEALAPFGNKAESVQQPTPKPTMPARSVDTPRPPFVQQKPLQKVDLSSIATLDELKKKITETNICELQQFATNTVFGDGNPHAKILIIGEAPGQEEDEQGIPFCGRSGQLLMNAFASVGLKRDKNFFITNNIFWRPPGNRKPTDEELLACKPWLEKICETIKPEVIICVGGVAAQNVLQTQDSISSLRGRPFPCRLGIETKAFCVYHPSYLLRSPAKKYEMYKDLLTILPSISHLL